MAYRPDGQSGFNFDLTASTSDTYETGLKSQNQLGDFTLAVFRLKLKMTLFRPVTQMADQRSVMQIKPYVKV